MRVLVEPLLGLGHLDLAEHLEGAGAGLGPADVAVEEDALRDLATDGHGRVERGHRVLGDQGDLVTPDIAHLPLVERGQIPTEQGHRAAAQVPVVG